MIEILVHGGKGYCLDWPIRKQRTDEIEYWLAQSDRLLAGTGIDP